MRYRVIQIKDVPQTQRFVFCNLERVARLVASKFHDFPESTKSHRWTTGHFPEHASRWAVVEVLEKPPVLAPRVLSCINPKDDLFSVVIEGLTGAQCLARFEKAQQTESVSWDYPGTTPHSNDNSCKLDADQLALAKLCWSKRLRDQQDAVKAREQLTVTCDDVDEMPNMVYVADDF